MTEEQGGDSIQPKKAKETALAVVEQLKDAEYNALLAGGCVRDMLMGRDPADFDVATDAPPEKVQQLFDKTIPVGVSFGVVIVLTEGVKTEVATFRADGEYLDGRRPETVTFCDARGDAMRRDFTINAMFYDPSSNEVIDFVGGKDDIEARLIRTVGEPLERFSEDRLRMLRAVRLAVVLDFSMDRATSEAIKRLAEKIISVSGERLRDELGKMLANAKRSKGIELMDDLGLLDRVLPEVAALKEVEQSPELHPEGDAFRHTLKALDQLGESDFRTAMSVLLHDVGKSAALEERGTFHGHEKCGADAARRVCGRLKLPKADTDCICWAIEKHLVFKDAQQMRESTLRKLLGHQHFSVLLELHRADTFACGADPSNYEFVRSKLDQYSEEPILPAPLLNGDDLITLGLEPGPPIGEILTKVRDAQLEGQLSNKEEALTYARKLIKDLS